MSRNPSKYNIKPIPKELRLNGNAVEALAQEMGIPFRRYRNPRHQIVEDASQREPDIAYLVDPVDTTDFECDAMLYWKNRNNTNEIAQRLIDKICVKGGLGIHENWKNLKIVKI